MSKKRIYRKCCRCYSAFDFEVEEAETYRYSDGLFVCERCCMGDFLQSFKDRCVDKYGDSILEEAQELIHGPRRETYDHPYDNHKRIADFWNVYLGDKLKEDLTPRDAAMCIVFVKVAREMFKSKRDNGVDICGYSGVIELIDEREEELLGEASGSWHRGVE